MMSCKAKGPVQRPALSNSGKSELLTTTQSGSATQSSQKHQASGRNRNSCNLNDHVEVDAIGATCPGNLEVLLEVWICERGVQRREWRFNQRRCKNRTELHAVSFEPRNGQALERAECLLQDACLNNGWKRCILVLSWIEEFSHPRTCSAITLDVGGQVYFTWDHFVYATVCDDCQRRSGKRCGCNNCGNSTGLQEIQHWFPHF